MSSASAAQLVSVADYLDGELDSSVKHEYLGGMIYAMAGATNVHNLVASNFLGSLHGRLRGGPCRPYNSDTKVRVELPTQTRFYYPDGSVVCESNPASDTFQDNPIVVAEVLSPKTRRTDEGEKKDAYLTIPSLRAYLLIEPESPAVCVYRRSDEGFVREDHVGVDATIPLFEVETELPLAELYDGVDLVTPSAADE